MLILSRFIEGNLKMKILTHRYHDKNSLVDFIEKHNILDNNLLIQVFTAVNKREFIHSLIQEILLPLPKSKIIGTTTSGEISTDGVSEYSTILAFCIFEKTLLDTYLIDSKENSFQTGKNLASLIPTQSALNIKLIISYTDGLHTNGEEFLNGISSLYPNLVVAGGMAGDYSLFEDTFVFTQDGIIHDGAVMCSFENKDLQVFTEYSFNWETMGKSHYIEKAQKNRVYRIDNKTAVEFYKYYLGDNIEELLPAIGIEFPLVIERNGIKIGRAVIEKHDDGSLSFAGNIKEGSAVKFGHGNVSMILQKSTQSARNLLQMPVEGIFIYSCMARKFLLENNVNMEVLPFKQIAPMCGFFTNGEFFHNSKEAISQTKLLNESMTVVAISEKASYDSDIKFVENSELSKHDIININRLEAVSHLISRTTSELESISQNLQERVEIEVKKNIEKDSLVNVMQAQAQIGSMMEMILHQWRQPLSAMSVAATGLKLKNELNMLDKQNIEQTSNTIIELIEHTNQTIDDFRQLFMNNQTFEKINPRLLVEKTKILFHSLFTKKTIQFSEHYGCSKEGYLLLPIGQMIQVLSVIFKNSIDVFEEREIQNPKISVTFEKYNSMCNLIIEDNGGGLEESLIEKIFDSRFTTKAAKNGTGIGLDICKRIVENNINGKIYASNGKEGAIFTIEIPSFKD